MFQSNTKPKLVLFCGLPGSGKTTLAKKLEKELPAVRLCPDEWMAGLGINLFDEAIRNRLEIQLWEFAQSLLTAGHNVILENGLWSRKERMDKLQDAAKLEVDVELHYLNVPFEELMRRLKIRNNSGDPNTVPLSREHMEGYAKVFQAPDATELTQFTQSFVYDAKGQREQSTNSTEQKIVHAINSLTKPENRPLIIAVSGFGGSGKSTLATKLKERLGETEVIAADDFIISRCKERTADWSSYDRPRLQQQVLEPAVRGEPISYQVYDWKNDRLGEWRTVPRARYLIVEGLSILHPDLRKYYDLTIWVDCPLEVATQRGIERDRAWGNDHDNLWRNIWMPNERDFMAKYRPDLAADITLNTN